ncbi:MAG: DivIVA domain-containing protein, partial [Acidobacteria bacterium]
MASDRIEELRTVRFPTERRGGYDRRAVDAFLAELADWLETGGEDEARRALVRRAMGEVGERTGPVERTEFVQQRITRPDARGRRGVEEREVLDVAQAEGLHAQDDIGERLADGGVGLLAELRVVEINEEAVGDDEILNGRVIFEFQL